MSYRFFFQNYLINTLLLLLTYNKYINTKAVLTFCGNEPHDLPQLLYLITSHDGP